MLPLGFRKSAVEPLEVRQPTGPSSSYLLPCARLHLSFVVGDVSTGVRTQVVWGAASPTTGACLSHTFWAPGPLGPREQRACSQPAQRGRGMGVTPGSSQAVPGLGALPGRPHFTGGGTAARKL